MAAVKSAVPFKGMIDPHQQGDYPIILGESLKNSSQLDQQNVRLRYNWIPRAGFADRSGNITRNETSFKLHYGNDDETYSYSGWDATEQPAREDSKSSRLVLIHDPESQAFKLEKINVALDLNLDSATEVSDEQLAKITRIAHPIQSLQRSNTNATHEENADSDGSADPTNPFDFRHFLSEARDFVDKSAQPIGARTPVPGGRTPLSIGSPAAAPARFVSPQFKPTPVVSTKKIAELPQPRKKVSATSTSRKTLPTKPRPHAEKPSQALSKERISDSDEDMEDVPVLPADAGRSAGGHQRNVSTTSINKPPRIFADGGLEIDYGSPPLEAKRRNRINPEAFRSQSGTPTFGSSSNRRRYASPPLQEIDMRDSGSADEEEHDGLIEDDDVEEMNIGSPREQETSHSPSSSRKRSHHALTPPRYKLRSPSPPRAAPIAQHAQEDDDDALALAAELEQALDQVGDEGFGLGIQTMADDESEVSEEE